MTATWSNSQVSVDNRDVTPAVSHAQLPGLNAGARQFEPLSVTQQTFNTVSPDAFILLPTAWVKVEFKGRSHYFRALIDQASQVSLITESCCQKLQLARSQSLVSVEGVSLQFSEKTKGQVSFNIRSIINPEFECAVDAWVLNKITNYQPLVSSGVAALPHLSSLDLADSKFFYHQSIDLLLGAEVHARIISKRVSKGLAHEPVASNTKLGRIISGPSAHSTQSSVKTCHLIDNLTLLQVVEKFWALEEVTLPTSNYTVDEVACESHFVKTHSRDSLGRYVVRLPFDQKQVNSHGLHFEGQV